MALRNAANIIDRLKKGNLVIFFKGIAYKKGRGAAITTTARKMAEIIWNMTVGAVTSIGPDLTPVQEQRLIDWVWDNYAPVDQNNAILPRTPVNIAKAIEASNRATWRGIVNNVISHDKVRERKIAEDRVKAMPSMSEA